MIKLPGLAFNSILIWRGPCFCNSTQPRALKLIYANDAITTVVLHSTSTHTYARTRLALLLFFVFAVPLPFDAASCFLLACTYIYRSFFDRFLPRSKDDRT